MMSITVRRAQPDDASGIANVHVNAWREAYAGLIEQDYLDSLPLSFKRRETYWRGAIQQSGQPTDVFVAESAEHGIVGFVSTEIARDERFAGTGELTAIYLLKRYHRIGIGHRLLQIAFENLRTQGFSAAYCWVLEGNPTIRFYEKTGATMTSETKQDSIGSKVITELAFNWANLKI